MKNLLKATTFAVAITMGGTSAFAAELNIAVIDVQKVLHDIPQRKAIETKLKSEFDSRVREMQRMETDGQTLAQKLKKNESFMSADERTQSQRKLAELQSDFNLKGQALQEDQRRRFSEEQQKIFKKIDDAVQSIAKSEGYDMVLNRQAVVFTNGKTDISDRVIQAVSKQ